MLTNLAIRNLTKNYLSEDCFKLIKVMSDNFKELQKDSNIKSIIKLANKIFSKDEGEYILCLAESLNWFKSIEDNIYQLSFYKNNIEFDLTLQRGIDLEINGLDFDIINKMKFIYDTSKDLLNKDKDKFFQFYLFLDSHDEIELSLRHHLIGKNNIKILYNLLKQIKS